MKLLLYCTKAKPYLYYAQESRTLMEIDNSFEGYKTTNKNVDDTLNGKIVAECDFEVEEIKNCFYADNINCFYRDSRLTFTQLKKYLQDNKGYAIHIKNLHIFDEPKNLDEVYYKSVYSWGITYEIGYHRMHRAPKNIRYVYDKEGKEKKIIIPVSPEEMCRIANKEQTALVRKKVLKEMV